jgi:hypothetical protein
MSLEKPDYKDAELVLRLYELRREAVMRESRDYINGKFWPTKLEDVLALTNPEHPHSAAFRQVTTYWEMAYGIAKHGIANVEYLVENNGEGLFLFAKIQPFLEQLRKEVSPTMLQNCEWVATKTSAGHNRFEIIKQRVQKILAEKK